MYQYNQVNLFPCTAHLIHTSDDFLVLLIQKTYPVNGEYLSVVVVMTTYTFVGRDEVNRTS